MVFLQNAVIVCSCLVTVIKLTLAGAGARGRKARVNIFHRVIGRVKDLPHLLKGREASVEMQRPEGGSLFGDRKRGEADCDLYQPPRQIEAPQRRGSLATGSLTHLDVCVLKD